jgi:hypothetical protein
MYIIVTISPQQGVCGIKVGATARTQFGGEPKEKIKYKPGLY